MNQQVEHFNLRVYGLLMYKDCVLVTDEHRGIEMTKFPGGGLEKGEGIADCLVREFDEELGITIEVGDFFYVNDFLQISAFKRSDQLISFYYIVKTAAPEHISVVDKRIALQPGHQTFRWVKLSDLNVADFTFPIDRLVVEKLLNTVQE